MKGPSRRDAREERRLRRAVWRGGDALRDAQVTAGRHRFFYRVSRAAGSPALPLVLVHGLVVSGRYLIPLGERLARRYDVYIPDLPGFGNTRSPAGVQDVPALGRSLALFMDALGLRGACLVGNSMGCQVAVELAARRPDLACAAVLTGPTPDIHARSGRRHMLRFAKLATREPVSYWPVLALDLAQAGVHRAIRTFHALLTHRMEERLRGVTCPTLVVRGGRDPIVSQRWAEEATQRLPRGTLRIIARGAHVVNYGAPVELARLTDHFLRTRVIPEAGGEGAPPVRGARQQLYGHAAAPSRARRPRMRSRR